MVWRRLRFNAYYGNEADVVHWHQTAKGACSSPFGDVYPRYKMVRRLFYLKHRNEGIGVGGLFFDDLNEQGFDKSFAFLRAVGDSYVPAYQPDFWLHVNTPYGERERQFNSIVVAATVGTNLVYDRGTLFGLQTGGRTESILMSLPPLVRWEYDFSARLVAQKQHFTSSFCRIRNWLNKP